MNSWTEKNRKKPEINGSTKIPKKRRFFPVFFGPAVYGLLLQFVRSTNNPRESWTEKNRKKAEKTEATKFFQSQKTPPRINYIYNV